MELCRVCVFSINSIFGDSHAEKLLTGSGLLGHDEESLCACTAAATGCFDLILQTLTWAIFAFADCTCRMRKRFLRLEIFQTSGGFPSSPDDVRKLAGFGLDLNLIHFALNGTLGMA